MQNCSEHLSLSSDSEYPRPYTRRKFGRPFRKDQQPLKALTAAALRNGNSSLHSAAVADGCGRARQLGRGGVLIGGLLGIMAATEALHYWILAGGVEDESQLVLQADYVFWNAQA